MYISTVTSVHRTESSHYHMYIQLPQHTEQQVQNIHVHKHCYLSTQDSKFTPAHVHKHCYLGTHNSKFTPSHVHKHCYLSTQDSKFTPSHSHQNVHLSTSNRNFTPSNILQHCYLDTAIIMRRKYVWRVKFWIILKRFCLLRIYNIERWDDSMTNE